MNESTCPFCGGPVSELRVPSDYGYIHKPDCAYVLALWRAEQRAKERAA